MGLIWWGHRGTSKAHIGHRMFPMEYWRILVQLRDVPKSVGLSCGERRKVSHDVCGHLLEKQGLVRLAGIEPTTLGFGGRYSIH